jgi:transcriptional regulator with XRE-family HTH domain
MRRKAGLSQSKLAERMGTTQSAISELEGGIASPTVVTLLRYAAQLGMAVVLTVEQEID